MAILRITNGFDGLTDSELTAKVRFILSEMTGNSNFPTPNPAIAVVTTALEELDAAVVAAESGGTYEKAVRDDKREVLISLVHNLSSYVLYTAAGDRLVAQSSGYSIAKLPTPQDPIVKAQSQVLTEGDEPGQLRYSFNRVKGARSYMYQFTQDPLTENSVWQSRVGTVRKTVLTGITSKEKYWVRVVAIGINGQQVPSDPISKVVQ